MDKIPFILLVVGIILLGCFEKKNKTVDGITSSVSEERKTEFPLKDISKAQQELANRTGFDRTILSYDTTNLKQTDSLPLRLMHELDRYHRIPPYKIIAGKKMKRNGIGYEYKDKEWHIKTQYPGVVGYFPRHWGDYIKKVEYYDEAGELLRTLDFDKLTPYSSGAFKNIAPGSFDFESMDIEKGYYTENYIEEALALKEDRTVILLKNTSWIAANYKLLALGALNRVIGYESTLVVYNEKGEVQYSTKLPFSVGRTFISTDNKYFVYAPSRANYMPQSDTLKGELFVVDLTRKKKIFTQSFDNKNIVSTGFRESSIENVLRCNFKTYNKLDKKEAYHLFVDLPKEAFFQINKNKIKASLEGKYDHSARGLLLKNEYQYRKF